MKTPIMYYGGKTNMLKHILPLIPPDHKIYVEPFVGGGAVLFAKEPSEIEVINDKFELCTNFYQVCQRRYSELKELLNATLHSESDQLRSKLIMRAAPDAYDPVLRAWAFWAQTHLTFSHKIDDGFAFARGGVAKTTAKKN